MKQKFLAMVTNHAFMLWFHIIGFVVFIALMYPSIAFKSWRESIPLLVGYSVYANAAGHLSGISAAAAGMEAQDGD